MVLLSAIFGLLGLFSLWCKQCVVYTSDMNGLNTGCTYLYFIRCDVHLRRIFDLCGGLPRWVLPDKERGTRIHHILPRKQTNEEPADENVDVGLMWGQKWVTTSTFGFAIP